jgi:hypothetical protein
VHRDERGRIDDYKLFNDAPLSGSSLREFNKDIVPLISDNVILMTNNPGKAKKMLDTLAVKRYVIVVETDPETSPIVKSAAWRDIMMDPSIVWQSTRWTLSAIANVLLKCPAMKMAIRRPRRMVHLYEKTKSLFYMCKYPGKGELLNIALACLHRRFDHLSLGHLAALEYWFKDKMVDPVTVLNSVLDGGEVFRIGQYLCLAKSIHGIHIVLQSLQTIEDERAFLVLSKRCYATRVNNQVHFKHLPPNTPAVLCNILEKYMLLDWEEEGVECELHEKQTWSTQLQTIYDTVDAAFWDSIDENPCHLNPDTYRPSLLLTYSTKPAKITDTLIACGAPPAYFPLSTVIINRIPKKHIVAGFITTMTTHFGGDSIEESEDITNGLIVLKKTQ